MDQNQTLRLLICSLYCVAIGSCTSMQGHFYRIERGDSLWRIAHENEIEIQEIQRANPQLDMDHISVGDRILIPGTKQIKKPKKPALNTQKWVQPTPKTITQKPAVAVNKSTTPATHTIKFKWPYQGPVISTFGKRNLKMHNGIDILIPPTETIRASASGKVVYVGDDIEGYDRIIIVMHDHQIFTIYALLGEFLVQEGTMVKVGESLAKPRAISPKSFFHFEIRHIKTSLDPQKILQ